MINHIETINQILDKEEKISKKQLDEAIKKVDMEEDIKILENVLETKEYGLCEITDTFYEAIENLLKRYRELEEEVESQDKTIDKLVEEQEEREKYTHSLEEENKELKNNYINPSKARISYYDTKKGTEIVIEGFIPISVIQNILDYYIGMYEIGKLHEDEASKYQMQAILEFIKDLQEILEKGNK